MTIVVVVEIVIGIRRNFYGANKCYVFISLVTLSEIARELCNNMHTP